MKSRALRILAPLILAAGAVVTASSSAAASNLPYDGKDAYDYGCSHDAKAVKSKTDYYYSSMYNENVWVKAILWYSPGCRTVWAMVDSNVPDNYWAGLGCNIHRNSDGKYLGCNRQDGTREWHSPMLNDKNVTGYAVAWGNIGNDPHTMIATTGSY